MAVYFTIYIEIFVQQLETKIYCLYLETGFTVLSETKKSVTNLKEIVRAK